MKMGGATNWTPMCGGRRRSRFPPRCSGSAAIVRKVSATVRNRIRRRPPFLQAMAANSAGKVNTTWNIVCRESRHGGHPATERGPVIGTSGSAGFGSCGKRCADPAGVALLDMATERRRPANLDRRHHAPCGSTKIHRATPRRRSGGTHPPLPAPTDPLIRPLKRTMARSAWS
jgi:hypothetical protein